MIRTVFADAGHESRKLARMPQEQDLSLLYDSTENDTSSWVWQENQGLCPSPNSRPSLMASDALSKFDGSVPVQSATAFRTATVSKSSSNTCATSSRTGS
jgi:hypothetical protein